MEDESRQHRYARLLREERKAFESASAEQDAGPERREALARRWFKSLHAVLHECWLSHARSGEGGPLQPFPQDAVYAASKLAQALSTGNVPDPIKNVTAGGGSPERYPGARSDIATALDYIEHARSGAVQDRAFIRTVVEAFSVDQSTVRDWGKAAQEIQAGLAVVPPDQFPHALKVAGARYHWNRKGEKTEGVD
jgi:hypothetical protein